MRPPPNCANCSNYTPSYFNLRDRFRPPAHASRVERKAAIGAIGAIGSIGSIGAIGSLGGSAIKGDSGGDGGGEDLYGDIDAKRAKTSED